MKYIGAHVSASGGVEHAPHNAQEIGANAFALFTRNPRSWSSKPFSQDAIDRFKQNQHAVRIESKHIMPHDSYLINVGSPKTEIREKSIVALTDEVVRAEQLGVLGVNFHPGAHLKMITVEACIEKIAEALNGIIAKTSSALLIIENTAGQGTTIGRNFKEIAAIISFVDKKERIGVCLDTCHLFASEYDIRTAHGWDDTMSEFIATVGQKYLKGMHINDSKGALGSNVDRHNNLGFGELGWDCFKYIMRDRRVDGIPLILETIDATLWAKEVSTLHAFAKE